MKTNSATQGGNHDAGFLRPLCDATCLLPLCCSPTMVVAHGLVLGGNLSCSSLSLLPLWHQPGCQVLCQTIGCFCKIIFPSAAGQTRVTFCGTWSFVVHLSWLTWRDQRQPPSDTFSSFIADGGMHFIVKMKFGAFSDHVWLVFLIKLANISKGKITQRNYRVFKG